MFLTESLSASSRKRELPFAGRAGQHLRRDVPAAPASQNIPAEDADAKMTGTTRSLQRRVLALNFPVRGGAPKLAPTSA